MTLAVPVYADWASLRQCIESLAAHVDTRHSVLLVNDCGPQADALEDEIRRAIKGRSNFAYHRNARNLGFAKTCNRAVFELDRTDNDVLLLHGDTIVTAGFLEEMLEVLHLIDRHGVVTPRSNDATVATVPLYPLAPLPRDDLDYATRVYEAVRNHLPRFSVVPVGVGFCLLVKRRLIQNFGLLDEAFGRGPNEETDFCLRLNQYGYSTVLANRAFVYHLEGGSSSAERRAAFTHRQEAVLLQGHRHDMTMVRRYFQEHIDPVDHFADAIAAVNTTLKVLINLYYFPSVKAGTTKAGIGLLRYLRSLDLAAQNIEVTILCQLEAVEYHGLGRFGLRLIHPDTIGDELFHISYSPLQFFQVENLILSNRHALRNVFALLDIISVRCQYLLAMDPSRRAVFLDALRLADRVVTISEFTKADALAYFNASAPRFANKITPIHLGAPDGASGNRQDAGERRRIRRPTSTDADRFILVFGNDYHHKAIARVLPYLEKQDVVSVVLGPRRLRSGRPNVVVVPSGDIADEEVEALLAHCSLVLFPSQYEGFGLPILEAAHHGKPVLYCASDVGDEIAELARPYVPVAAFETFDELPAKIGHLLGRAPVVRAADVPPLRSLDDYHREVFALLVDLARQPYTDFDGLRDRWQYFTNVREYYGGGLQSGLRQAVRQRVVAKLKQYPGVYRATRRIYRQIRSRLGS